MLMRVFAAILMTAAAGMALACGPVPSTAPFAGDLAGSLALVPTSDVSASRMVGVPNSAALFTNVDDGALLTASDSDATYVRAFAGTGTGSHFVGYSGGPPGVVTQVTVQYTASRGTASRATAQVRLYDGPALLGSGSVNALGGWAGYSDTFGGLSVSSAARLRTEMVLTNTSGTGAARYSMITLSVAGGGTVDAGVPPPPPRPPPPPPPPPPPGGVDATTMTGKLMMGYQGWFFCPGDGSPINRFIHWFGSNGAPTTDLWPDMRELPVSEQCLTSFSYPGGGNAPVYSAFRESTVVRHFQWMQDNHLDGVMLQRFSSELTDPAFFVARNKVTQNVMKGAEATGRTFDIMYDISGQPTSTLVAALENDWKYLVDTLKVTASPRYLHHKGKPVLAIWGFGFSDRSATPAQAQTLIDFFKNNPNPSYQVTLMLGVPRDWRSNATWADTLRRADVISPWTVGSYVDDNGVDNYKSILAADLADLSPRHVDYMPVVFPGFSWNNLHQGPLNQIPRRGGTFYWRQVYDALSAGSQMVYGAMFDEVDEGTAMFKVGATRNDIPVQAPYLWLDIDGLTLPSDWYLRVADQAGRMLRKEIPLTSTLPIAP